MIPRISLGYVFAVLAFVPFLAGSLRGEQVYSFEIRMRTDAPGTLQVFYDIGNGIREADSAIVFLSETLVDYTLPLPSGVYKTIRIDPGSGAGRYTIERVAIFSSDRVVGSVLNLDEITPAHQLSVVERTPEHLVVDSPPGSNDPQLLYVPTPPLALVTAPRELASLLGRLLVFSAVGTFLVALLEVLTRRASPVVVRWLSLMVHWSCAHPRIAVLATAAAATLVATYPIVLLNRSLVTPNNGGVAMLYDRPPFVPGSDDKDIEDVRRADIGAAMWAFVPYSKVQRDALIAGELPLWNRFNATGRPLWGQGQTFFLDPLHWLTFVSSDPAVGWDLKFVAHRFVFAAGVGFAVFAALRAWLPAAVVAAASPFIGYFAFRFNHPAIFSFSYAPWTLVGWFALAAATTRFQMARAAILMAGASALVLLGSPPKEAATMLAACHSAGVLALLLTRDASQYWRRLGFAALGLAAMATITAPHWMLFLTTLRSSFTGYDSPRAIFAPPEAAPTLLIGSIQHEMALPSLHITSMLLLVATFSAPRRLGRHPTMLACVIAAALLMLVAFGAFPAAWLMSIPFVANIHQINITTIAAALVLLLVASAIGFEALWAATPSQTRVLTIVVALGSVWLFLSVMRVTTLDRLEAWLAGLLLIGVTAVPISLQCVRRSPGRILPVFAALSLFALVLVPGGLHVESGMPALDRVLEQPRQRAALNVNSPAVDAIRRVMTEPARTAGMGLVLLPGSNGLYGLEGIGGPDALELPQYEALVEAAGVRKSQTWFWVLYDQNDLTRLASLLDMLNVEFLLTSSDSVPPGMTVVPVTGLDNLRVIRRPSVWPRAFFSDGIARYTTPGELVRLAAESGGPIAAVQRGDDRATIETQRLGGPTRPAIPAERYYVGTNTTGFSIRAPGPGVAVLTEAFVPDDFDVRLNGQPATYFRVNHAFKGVVIPNSGRWDIAFTYRPARWRLSIAVAIGGLAILAVLVVASRSPRYTAGVGTSENPAARASS